MTRRARKSNWAAITCILWSREPLSEEIPVHALDGGGKIPSPSLWGVHGGHAGIGRPDERLRFLGLDGIPDRHLLPQLVCRFSQGPRLQPLYP